MRFDAHLPLGIHHFLLSGILSDADAYQQVVTDTDTPLLVLTDLSS